MYIYVYVYECISALSCKYGRRTPSSPSLPTPSSLTHRPRSPNAGRSINQSFVTDEPILSTILIYPIHLTAPPPSRPPYPNNPRTRGTRSRWGSSSSWMRSRSHTHIHTHKRAHHPGSWYCTVHMCVDIGYPVCGYRETLSSQ